MAEVQVFLNGQKLLENRSTFVMSPGNPHYYDTENLEKLFTCVKDKTDKVRIFIPDKPYEHSYRAAGSKIPGKRARANANLLRNRCKKVMTEMGCEEGKFSFVKWLEDVESSPAYAEVLQTVTDLYRGNEKFRFDMQEQLTKPALASMKRKGETAAMNATMKSNHENPSTDMSTAGIDIEEGVQYLQKEIAFLHALPRIYSDCEEFVFVYHIPVPFLTKYFDGVYDGIMKPFMGFVVVH